MKEFREIVGDRRINIFPAGSEMFIQVSTSVIASIELSFNEPPSGEEIVQWLKDKKEPFVISKSNTIFCDNDLETQYALSVLDSLSDSECSRIKSIWDSTINRVYRR